MIQVEGTYKEHEKGVFLVIELPREYFLHVKKHVTESMFLSYTTLADRHKKILITSVGDHLNKYEDQDVVHADVSISVQCAAPSKEVRYQLDNDSLWFVHIKCGKSGFLFSLDKLTKFIVKRQEYEDSNK